MRKLALLLNRIYILLLFIVFEAIAISVYAGSTNQTRAKFLAISNSILGDGYRVVSGVKSYFGQGEDNKRLTAEVARLHNELGAFTTASDSVVTYAGDSLTMSLGYRPYIFSAARVVNNTLTQQRNYITLDKGTAEGVKPNMAITTPEGAIVGYVLSCSPKFAVCVSVLNTEFRASGRINNTDSYGPILWDGKSDEYITLTDIPKYTQINRGDTVLTTGFSAIFPPDMMVGTVESFEFNQSMLYQVKVLLTARMSSLNHVLLVDYTDYEERTELEEKTMKDHKPSK